MNALSMILRYTKSFFSPKSGETTESSIAGRFHQNASMSDKPASQYLSKISLSKIQSQQVLDPLNNIALKIQADHDLSMCETKSLISHIIKHESVFKIGIMDQQVNLGQHILNALNELPIHLGSTNERPMRTLAELQATLEKNCKVSLSQWLKGQTSQKLSYQNIIVALSSLAQRPSVEFKIFGKNFTQFCESANVLAPNRSRSIALSFSSGIAANGSMSTLEKSIPNLESQHKRNGNTAVIRSDHKTLVTRSAKSDTIEKFEELLALSARHNLRYYRFGQVFGKGFISPKTDQQATSYQLVVSCALDVDWFTQEIRETKTKSEAPRYITSRKDGVTLFNLSQSLNTIFGEDHIILRNIEFSDPRGQKRIIPIRFYKPLLTVFNFTHDQIKHSVLTHNRAFNRVTTRKLTASLYCRWRERPHLFKLSSLLSTLDQNPDNLSLVQDEYEQLKQNHAMTISELAAANYIALNETGEVLEVTPEGFPRKLLDRDDNLVEFLLLRGFVEEVGTAHSVQCPSGEESSTIMASAAIAADAVLFHPQPPRKLSIAEATATLFSPRDSEPFRAAFTLSMETICMRKHPSQSLNIGELDRYSENLDAKKQAQG